MLPMLLLDGEFMLPVSVRLFMVESVEPVDPVDPVEFDGDIGCCIAGAGAEVAELGVWALARLTAPMSETAVTVAKTSFVAFMTYS